MNTWHKYLRITGYLEGTSFLVLLFIAMPLKYLADMPLMVRYVGWAHGLLFMFYVIVVLIAWHKLNWPFKNLALGLIASVVPFGPFIFERRIRK